MKYFYFAVALSMFLIFSVTGCGSGSGSDGSSVSTGGSETTSASTAVGSITLAWDAPTNSDGSPLLNVAGYNVHYGTTSGNYDKTANAGTLTSCTITGLAPGTYYMAVTCYDASGNESSYSNEVSKTVQ